MEFKLNELQKWIYNLIYEGIKLSEFESWLYSNENLENYISHDNYIDLISLDYNSKYAKAELFKVVDKYINYGIFESIYLLRLLEKCQNKDIGFANLSLTYQEFYYMYCKGYTFLGELGIMYGLACIVPPDNYASNEWHELKDSEKEEIINSFYPEASVYIENTIELIRKGKVLLTGRKNELDRWQFIDNR